jgi:hypothetical protein
LHVSRGMVFIYDWSCSGRKSFLPTEKDSPNLRPTP